MANKNQFSPIADKNYIISAIRFRSLAEIKAAIEARKENLQKSKSAAKPLSDSFDYLKFAIERADPEIVRFLIDEEVGAALREDYNSLPANFGVKALHSIVNRAVLAVSFGALSIPESSFFVKRVDRHETALHAAARKGQVDILRELILLDQIDLMDKDYNGHTVFDIATKFNGNKEAKETMMSLLKDAQEMRDSFDNHKTEFLQNKIVKTNIPKEILPSQLRAFLPQSGGGGGKNVRGPDGVYRDSAAFYKEDNDVMKELRKKLNKLNEARAKIKCEIKDFLDRAEGYSSKEGHSNASIEEFIKKGHSLDITTDYYKGGQESAMHLAAKKGDFATIETLFRYGASVNLINSKGRTALDEASLLDEVKFPNKKKIIDLLTPHVSVQSPSATRVMALMQKGKSQ